MMYPIFALGLLTVGSSARFALRGEHQLLGFVGWMMRTLLAAAGFGWLAEMMRILSASQGPSDPLLISRIVMEGTQEEFLASKDPKVREFLERDFQASTFAERAE